MQFMMKIFILTLIILTTLIDRFGSISFAKNNEKVCPTLRQAFNKFGASSVRGLERKMHDYGYFGPISNTFRLGDRGIALWMKEGHVYNVVIRFDSNQKTIRYYNVLWEQSNESLIKALQSDNASSGEIRCLLQLKENGVIDGSW
jgi:hypothetical protein